MLFELCLVRIEATLLMNEGWKEGVFYLDNMFSGSPESLPHKAVLADSINDSKRLQNVDNVVQSSSFDV